MKKRIETISLLSYLIISIVGLFLIFNLTATFGYKKIGESALNVAKLLSATVVISDKDVDELISIEFDELLDNKVNKQVEQILSEAKLDDNIECAYIYRKLDDNQMKYRIENQEQKDFYNAEIGTGFDYVWLVDYIVHDKTREMAYNDPNYYNDIYRYAILDEKSKNIYKNELTGYYINDDEWNKTITGYSPIYTTEGNFVGILGVDIFINDYYEYRQKMSICFFIIFLILMVLLLTILAFRHISDRNELMKDKLSGLHTRKYYEKFAFNKLKSIKSDSDTLTIMMFDIDQFKKYNDYYGHVRGDIIISTVCDIIKKTVHTYDGCAGRFGGEEFIAIIPNISIQVGNSIAEKIRKDIEQLAITHENSSTNKIVTISTGIYTIKGKKEVKPFEHLIEAADVGLYRAKNSGRNRVVRNENK